jgi:hypothetical protein
MTKAKQVKQQIFKDGYSSHPWNSADEFLLMKLKHEKTRWCKLYRAVQKLISSKVKTVKVKTSDIGFPYVDPRLPADVKKYIKDGDKYAIRNLVNKEMPKTDKHGNSKPTQGTISFDLIKL